MEHDKQQQHDAKVAKEEITEEEKPKVSYCSIVKTTPNNQVAKVQHNTAAAAANQQPKTSSSVPQSVESNPAQVKNEAGGFVYAVEDMQRFRRFLVLGSEGGTYYATQKKLSEENAQALLRLIETGRGPEAVDIVRQLSVEGRTAKQDPIIFALATCARSPDAKTKTAAYGVMNKVLRIPTHLFQFVEMCEQLSKAGNSTGWGRGHRKAITKWYNEKRGMSLANHVTKYKQRNGWSHRDLFRLCHIKPSSPEVGFIVKYVVKGFDKIKEDTQTADDVSEEIRPIYQFLEAVEYAKSMDAYELADTIRRCGLVREHMPTIMLNQKVVWEALLENMPMTAMIRNLSKMTSIGLLDPDSDGEKKVRDALHDEKKLADAKIHPFSVLVALRQYKAGKGDKGKLSWTPNDRIVSALDNAFHLAFKNVVPTGKRFLLAIDVSGSMTVGNCCGTPTITPRLASAAMAMVTARTEENVQFVGFSHKLVPLGINGKMPLDAVIKTIEKVPMGNTDCAQPMLYAHKKNLKVDTFIIYTDCETWCGKIHPDQALRKYRKASGIDAKLIVVAMTSNGFTLADPNDAGMLDMVGFDSAAPEIIRQFVLGEI